ncbi:mRNA turnover protein 4 homolog [Trichonephila clavata]|uniref:Ribosome assembly factor mrt4 n=1 Tax=Trichonephila clavata TaxID=2740835 RepID=A0A8X6F612_TRICU|nr:mRNA turnover protein 4 homolog [Trichonephila clavata]
MPKSKRNKIVELTKTKKHGFEGKKQLYEQIQSSVEKFAHVFVFTVNDMRNTKMKGIRDQWKHSRFCIGKNKVMAKALGLTEEDEFRLNLHKIGQQLKGERGLLFTNQPVEEVVNWFRSYSERDYARSGNIATEDVVLPEGPLKQFPHSLESYLRQLGLPTTLQKGVIHLLRDYVVCQAGDKLSPEAARILKLLGYQMAEFSIKIRSVWSQDGNFVDLDSEAKENEEDQEPLAKKSFKLVDLENDTKMEVIEDGLNEALSNIPKKLEDVQKSKQEVSKERLSEKYESKIDSEAEKEINKEILEMKEEVVTLEEENTNSEDMEESDVEEPTVNNSRASEKDFSEKYESKIDSDAEKEINKEILETKEEEEVVTLEEENTNSEDMEESDIEEPTVKKSRASEKGLSENTNIKDVEKSDVDVGNVEDVSTKEINKAEILKLTQQKIQSSKGKPDKFSPKLTRARAAAKNIKVKTPDSNVVIDSRVTRSTRKRKM